MKKIRWCPVAVVVLTLAVLLIAGDAVWNTWSLSADRDREKRAAQARHAVYQEEVKEYSEALKPGTTRAEVESYLRSQNREFSMSRGGELSIDNSRVYADLVKIGAEAAPWCSVIEAYVAFRFVPEGDWTPREADKLKDVIFFESGDCI